MQSYALVTGASTGIGREIARCFAKDQIPLILVSRQMEVLEKVRFDLMEVSKKPIEKKPTPPFTTSTLQQEASRKLGFSVSRTMSAAQKLYEQGHITYMRTDSVNLSNQAIKAIKETINNKISSKSPLYYSQKGNAAPRGLFSVY